MIFLRQPKILEHLEDHISAKTNGSRNFSDLLDAIQILPRRPISQVSSSFPSYYDEWDDSTNATEYNDIDDTTMGTTMSTTNPRTMMVSGSTILASLRTLRRRAKRGRARVSREARKGSKGESRDVLKFSTKQAGKGGRPENYKQVRLKLQTWSLTVGSGG